MKYRISTPNECVWCITQLAKLRFNHSIGRTHSWRFHFCMKGKRFPFGMGVALNPEGDASWWKGTRRWHSSTRSHSLFMLEETLSKKQQDRRSSCWPLLFTLNIIIKQKKTSSVRSKTKKNVSCEIEDFVENYLCKLCGILRSRVLRVLCVFI